MTRTLLVVAVLLAFGASSAEASVRDVRLLVVRLTWGPPVQTVEQVQREVAGADVFLRRSSFGRTTLRADVTPVIAGFVVPQRCAADADHGLRALSGAARAAAASLGYDLSAYDRFLYLFPAPCAT